MKMMKKQDMLKKNMEDNIKIERNILARMNNPFVVKLFYTFQSRNELFMVMEYIPGGDLAAMLKNLGCFSRSSVVAEIVSQCLRALCFRPCYRWWWWWWWWW
jgi:serine/threonine protein kinase